MSRTCLSVILAAGEGTRMKSAFPKVLHKMGGLPLVCHVVRAIKSAGAEQIAVVAGNDAQAVAAAVRPFADDAVIFEQKQRLGTAHAVLAARDLLLQPADDVLIAYGDTPLIEKTPLLKARKMLAQGADIVVTGFRTGKPAGYGRLIEKNGALTAIVEDKDASAAEKKITFCNGGLMAVRGGHLLSLLDCVKNKNVKGEYYLTDIVALGAARGLTIRAFEAPMTDVIGVNNRVELAEAEAVWQSRKRQEMMLAGVTLQAPETVFFSYDTEIMADAVIEPHVFFGPGVKIAGGAVIHAFSHFEGASIGPHAEIGPYARLRPGADLHKDVKIGNFCEIKKSSVGAGAKINHLAYIGDASIGVRANIGAGTITCNYDGRHKQQTRIGEGAFIGSNTSLVAPVSIGDNAYIASGSVITQNVADDALAFARARQVSKPGRAKILRELAAVIKKSGKRQ